MCIACEMDFWIVAEDVPEEPKGAGFACDAPEDEIGSEPKPASEPRD